MNNAARMGNWSSIRRVNHVVRPVYGARGLNFDMLQVKTFWLGSLSCCTGSVVGLMFSIKDIFAYFLHIFATYQRWMILVNFGNPDFGGHSISPQSAWCWLGGSWWWNDNTKCWSQHHFTPDISWLNTSSAKQVGPSDSPSFGEVFDLEAKFNLTTDIVQMIVPWKALVIVDSPWPGFISEG